MKQVLTLAAIGCILAGCATEVPNSARPQGVGFGDYENYQTTRETALTNGTTGPAISTEPIGGVQAATAGRRPGTNNPGISDEQNFDAVASRESIQSDAVRIEQQRQAYRQIGPEALPERSGSSGPNIVEYALSTRNSVGQQIHKRGRTSDRKFQRACSSYASADLAQEAFLAAGGPQRDRQGLDPDGDGFACAWNPAPFRAARAG